MHPIAHALYQSIAFAQVAKIIPRVPDPLPSPVKGELLSRMLPSVHVLTMISVLDEALSEYIETCEVPWPPKTKRDFFNRINVAAESAPSLDKDRLHQARELRNKVAHPERFEAYESVSWADVDAVSDIAVDSLLALGFDQQKRKVEAFFERSSTLYPNEPGPQGERIRYLHRVGATLDGESFLQYEVHALQHPPRAA